MTQLRTEEILKNNNTLDPNSITSLSLTHKTLSNVSCLSDFKNLERLDLTFNNLTSLKGLELCLNLKWLSVQQNKLQSLKGIEGLTNLTVLNVGKNKLRSMDEVKNLVKLRALILNDNEIASISGLDQLKELNTLVLSRNPICKMGNSLAKLKSIAKISLSNCQLEAIDSSVKGCTELEQLRLAHNDIQTIPTELGNNKKLQILDLGNNMISKWSDLEALSSIQNLKNLNLLGNPIAEKAKLLKKIKKLVPHLQIFNSKRMDQLNKIETDKKTEGAVVGAVDESKQQNVKKHDTDHMKRNHSKTEIVQVEEGNNEKSDIKKQKKKKGEKEARIENVDKAKKKISKRKAEQKADIDIIDDNETPFAELFTHNDSQENMKLNQGERRNNQENIDSISGLVIIPGKNKKAKKIHPAVSALEFVTPVTEVGLGGPSAWGD